MAEKYKSISVSEFKKLEDGDNNAYLIIGIPRAVEFKFCKEFQEGKDSYSYSFYLQNNSELVYVYAGSNDVYSKVKQQLLKAASESGLEILVRGTHESKEGNILKASPMYMDEMIIDGRVCPNNLIGKTD